MKIESVEIKNLRSIKQSMIMFDDYTSFVGANGAGKSTVLCALNIFFREVENASTDLLKLSAEDFHNKNTVEPIEITVTFVDLSVEAQDDFKEYYRQGKLVISSIAKYSKEQGYAEVFQHGQRLVVEEFKEFFKSIGDGAKILELRDLYTKIKANYPELPKESAKPKMVDALRSYEESHPESCSLNQSDDQFYGISKGKNRLEKYIQWVYVPAVKDAGQEKIEVKNSAIGKLISRTVRSKINFEEKLNEIRKSAKDQYTELLDANKNVLESISNSLEEKASLWAHPEATVQLVWQKDSDKSVQVSEPLAMIVAGERGFEGDLSRLGHGFQRSYILALLQELAGCKSDEHQPKLILGCEEPELHQHPSQIKHLSTVLKNLSNNNAQVFITTHNPSFVSGINFEEVRIVRRDTETKEAKICGISNEYISNKIASLTGKQPQKPNAIRAKLHSILQPTLNELFFTQGLILVEGLEDVAYINTWIELSGRSLEFRKQGLHIVRTDKKSAMIRPLIIAKGLSIPVYAIFDSDGDTLVPKKKGCSVEQKKIDNNRILHKRDNEQLLELCGGDKTIAFPTESYIGDNYTVWSSNMGKVIQDEIIEALGQTEFGVIKQKASTVLGHGSNLEKNSLYISEILRLVYETGSDIPSLTKLCNSILDFTNVESITSESTKEAA